MAANSKETTLWIRCCVKWGRAAILLYDGFVAIERLLSYYSQYFSCQ